MLISLTKLINRRQNVIMKWSGRTWAGMLKVSLCVFLLWRHSPSWAQAVSLLRFLDYTHTQTHSAGHLWTSDQPVAEAATYKKNPQILNSHVFSDIWTIDSIIGRLQIWAFDRTATGIGLKAVVRNNTAQLQTSYMKAHITNIFSLYIG